MRNIELPKPAYVLFINRVFRWTGLILTHWLTGNINRLRRRDDSRLRGPRLRRLFEQSGPSAVKIGLQVALRIDIFPIDICNELSCMADRAPAMPLEHAIGRIEAAGRSPLQKLFRVFDPEPIVADTISCVYQAELANGDRVAVKVRRPGILDELSADLKALGFLLSLLEFFTLVRPGTYGHLERELRLKLAEELDYLMAARYQRLFRRRAKRDGLKFLSAANVYAECNSSDVMVSEFIQGIWCHELMDPTSVLPGLPVICCGPCGGRKWKTLFFRLNRAQEILLSSPAAGWSLSTLANVDGFPAASASCITRSCADFRKKTFPEQAMCSCSF